MRNSEGAPVNAETMFQAGSISKPVAVLATLRLVQDGRMALDTDINTYLTSWKFPADQVAGGKPITLRQLLTHTAGEHTGYTERAAARQGMEILGRRLYDHAAIGDRRDARAIP